MENITVIKAAQICNGIFYGNENAKDIFINNVIIDSRKVEKGDLFVALKGENSDGHLFISSAFLNGASVVLSEQKLEQPQGAYILVESCMKALNLLAAYYRNSFDLKVVGITGSVGKTSTKEMIASVLSQKYNTLKTEGNYNNEIGLPLTIFRLDHTIEAAVFEMGISEFGEMRRLSSMAMPDAAVITNIGLCHLESLKSRDGILKAKTEILEHVKENASIILNGDDDKLVTVSNPKNTSLYFYGKEKESKFDDITCEKKVYATDITSKGLKGMQCVIHTPRGSFEALIPIPGAHNVYNALAATQVGLSFDLTLDEIKAGIETVKTISGRAHIIEVSGKTLIDDGYNANPVSMKAAFDILEMADTRKIAVLGDMKDLGDNEKQLHYETGLYLAKKQIDTIFCTGELMKELVRALKDEHVKMKVFAFETQQELEEALFAYIELKDTILIKSSHYFMDFRGLRERLKHM